MIHCGLAFRGCASWHDYALAPEQRNSVHSLFLDLVKAFDSVPHYHLLLRLDLLGIRGELLDRLIWGSTGFHAGPFTVCVVH